MSKDNNSILKLTTDAQGLLQDMNQFIEKSLKAKN